MSLQEKEAAASAENPENLNKNNQVLKKDHENKENKSENNQDVTPSAGTAEKEEEYFLFS